MTGLTPGRAYALALVLMTAGGILLIAGAGLPWLTLAAVLGIVATRSWARTLVAGLLAVAGAAAMAAAVGQAFASDGGEGTSGASWLLVLSGGTLVAVGALWCAIQGRRWPAMGGRYERAGGSSEGRARRSMSTWDALDQGLDPTDDASS